MRPVSMKPKSMRPINAVIQEVKVESPSVRTLRFALSPPKLNESLKPNSTADSTPVPGQYAMIWIRGLDEIPMGYSSSNEITVHMVGEATIALGEMHPGSSIGLRGPLGKGFTLLGERILLIGGGVGVAPLAFLGDRAKSEGIEVTTLMGFRSGDDAIFRDRMKCLGDLIITTDDGSLGIHGFTSAGLKGLDLESFSQIYLCGPELMMWDIISRSRLYAGKIQASINRYFKCAMGVCGSCCLDPDGMRVCVEGPVVMADRLLDSEFGKYRRGPTGGRGSCIG